VIIGKSKLIKKIFRNYCAIWTCYCRCRWIRQGREGHEIIWNFVFECCNLSSVGKWLETGRWIKPTLLKNQRFLVITIFDMLKMSAVTKVLTRDNECWITVLMVPNYLYRQFSLTKIMRFFTLHISSVLSVILRINNDYFRIRHSLISYYNRDCVCLLRGTNWTFNVIQVRFHF
jgi:hypothetical protein